MRKIFFRFVFVVVFFGACNRQTQVTKPIKTTASPSPIPTPEIIETNLPPTVRQEELNFYFSNGITTTEQSNLKISSAGLSIENNSESANFISEDLPMLLVDPAPFLALSATWKAEINPKAKLTISVRSSINKGDWSVWQASSLDGDPRTKAGLFFFPASTKYIQYKVEMQRDQNHSAPILKEVKFRFISPGATPKSFLAEPHQSIIKRDDWYCPDGKSAPKIKAQDSARHLIVHHTATNNSFEDFPAMVRCIWNFHSFTNGWGDLGYHYLIDPNGVIYEGKAGGDNSVGTHFSCANTGTIGIAMLGNYMDSRPSEKMITSLQTLLQMKCKELGIDPNGKSFHASTRLNLPTISGHREANESKVGTVCAGTKCPGDVLYEMLPEIRKRIDRR